MTTRVLTTGLVVLGLAVIATSWFWMAAIGHAVDAACGAIVRLVYGGA